MAVVQATRAEPSANVSGGEGETQSQSPVKKENAAEVSGGGGESEVAELRRRWELASVLNFLTVFAPMIGRDLKVSAEEIEAGLISPNSSLIQLHVTLLKGIPPVSKALDGSDAWVTVLCKKLAPWWAWVAEGEIPLEVDKGEEIVGYKGLDPMKRLLLLKALCEVRLEQDDAVAYINDALKQGTEVSSFCKQKLAGDGNGTAFWYEGNGIIGHRLYRGVTTFARNEHSKGAKCLNPPNFEWETLATNLEEFHKVVNEFSSSKDVAETVVCRTVQDEAVPSLEKIQRKKELAIKKKQKEEMILNHYKNSYGVRPTRMCRNLKPVNYTYDDYDRTVREAIRRTNEGTKTEEQSHGESEDGKTGGRNSAEADDLTTEKKINSDDRSRERPSLEDNNGDGLGKKSDTMDVDIIREASSDDEDYTYSGKKGEVEDSDFSDSGNSKQDRKSKQTGRVVAPRPFGSRWSRRLAGDAGQPFMETENLVTKKRMRQRPTLNSSLDCVVIPDSEDDS